ncbi:MAG: hypothetical protein BYD32DRAFT_223974 [Podila humilis]|nr:MAG: hypothetical protein BYD32DRAFT_223974 [Podila humilis]
MRCWPTVGLTFCWIWNSFSSSSSSSSSASGRSSISSMSSDLAIWIELGRNENGSMYPKATMVFPDGLTTTASSSSSYSTVSFSRP